MASAAEQLASSINFGALSKATELKQRIWYTLGILIVARASCEEHPASHGDFTARSTKRGLVRDPIAAVTGASEG